MSIRLIQIALCFLFMAQTAQAHHNRQGCVDVSYALNNTCDGQAAKRKLRAIRKALQARLRRAQSRLRRLARRPNRRQRRILRKKILQLRTMQQQMNRQLAQAEQRETGRILRRMQRVIARIARRHKLVFVFDKGRGGLLYNKPSRDFTSELIKRYNRTYCRIKKGKLVPKPSAQQRMTNELQTRLKALGIEVQN
jgi:Skp family chaperone for outer membrane proteins